MLTDYQVEVLSHKFKAQGREVCDSLEDARQLCSALKLADDDAVIIESRGRFYIEKDAGLIRSFETEHKIKP